MHDLVQAAEKVRDNAEAAFTTRYTSGADIEDFLALSPSDFPASDPGKKCLAYEKTTYAGAELLINLVNGLGFLFGGDQSGIEEEGEFGMRTVGPYDIALKLKKLMLPECHREGISLRITTSHAEVHCPRRRLEIALWAFLANAVKYSPKHVRAEIDIILKTHAGKFRICVVSLGPKIEEDERQAIFGIRSRGRHVDAFRGSGFGLAIASAAAKGWATIGVDQSHAGELIGGNEVYSTSFYLDVAQV